MRSRGADAYRRSCVEDGFAEAITDEQIAGVVAEGEDAQATPTTLIEPVLKECGAVSGGK